MKYPLTPIDFYSNSRPALARAAAVFICLMLAASSKAAEGSGEPSPPPLIPAGKDTESFLGKADKLYASGKYSAALTSYNQAIHKDTGNKILYRKRGATRMQLGDFANAIEDFRIANANLGPYRETKFPGHGAYLDWQRARKQYEHANYVLNKLDKPEQAITMYQTALSIYPPFPQCLHNLAIAYGKSKEYESAVATCIKAISYRYADWKFWNTLGLELYHQGKPRQALGAFKQALTLNPSEPNRVSILENIEFAKDRIR